MKISMRGNSIYNNLRMNLKFVLTCCRTALRARKTVAATARQNPEVFHRGSPSDEIIAPAAIVASAIKLNTLPLLSWASRKAKNAVKRGVVEDIICRGTMKYY
eukprot:scaffold37094_cov23-Prasinocladus_malaysianus.AAC.1